MHSKQEFHDRGSKIETILLEKQSKFPMSYQYCLLIYIKKLLKLPFLLYAVTYVIVHHLF